MKKIINITMVILICLGILFGSWKDRTYLQYIDKGISPPKSTFCLYDRVESFLAGIVGLWASINLILYKPPIPSKLFGKTNSFPRIVIMWCLGLLCLGVSISSFWDVYISNLPNCIVP
jgi:hypothetical protein